MHRGMTMRARLVPVLTGLVMGACAPAPGVTPSTTTPPPTTTTTTAPAAGALGGSVVVGIGDHGAPRTLNPFLDGPDTAVLDLLAPAIFATGFDVHPVTMEPVPEVLARIPTVANGGLIVNANGTMDVTVEVRPGAAWADGTPITAADLAFTIDTVLDPGLPIRADLRARYGRIVPGSVRARGAVLTFRMDVDASVELLFGIVLPAHQVEGTDFATDWNERTWVSGGPFTVADYRPGRYLDLAPNARYWKVGRDGGTLPGLERLVVRFFEGGDDPRVLRAFRAREIDVVVRSFPAGAADGYEALAPEGAEVVAVPGLEWEAIVFQFGPGNRNPGSLNRHLRFRRAVAHAVDRAALAETPGTFALSSVLRMYRPELDGDPWARYGPDPGETAGLLYALGEDIGQDLFAGEGPRLVVTASSDNPATVATAGRIVVMLNDAGIGAELQLEDAALFFGNTLDNGTWDAAVWRLAAVPGRSGAIAMIRMFDPEGLPFVGSNFARWGTVDSTVADTETERYARIVDQLEETVDPAEIDRLLAEAEQVLADQVVLLPLVVHERVGAAVWADRVSGVVANPAQGALWNVEEWRAGGA